MEMRRKGNYLPPSPPQITDSSNFNINNEPRLDPLFLVSPCVFLSFFSSPGPAAQESITGGKLKNRILSNQWAAAPLQWVANWWVAFGGRFLSNQVVTKRCRLSWLTNSALVYEPKCERRGSCSGSQPMSTAVHRSPNKLWRSPPYLPYVSHQF